MGHALDCKKNNNPNHDMKKTTQTCGQSNQREYVLKRLGVEEVLNGLQAEMDGAKKETEKGAESDVLKRRLAGEVTCAKTVIIRPPVAPSQPLYPSQRPKAAKGCSVIKLGLDVDKQRVTLCAQYDHGTIKPAARFQPDELVAWVKARVEEGHVVWTVYEACGFGYTLHWKLLGAGAINLVIAPIRLDAHRRRKTDGLDARALCTRLTRYLDGQRNELPVIRVPSVEEQQRRETGRQRLFWRSEVQRLASHGRALRLEHEHQELMGCWWTARNWKRMSAEITPFVREILETLRPQLEYAQKQVKSLTEQLEQRQTNPLPIGLGAMTMAIYDAEICDANRFSNRKQVGSYIGCCPSVYSSGNTMRMGSIDRHGNKHLRALLVEAVWRLVRYQPGWLAYQRVVSRMKAGAAIRKKTAVALARQLAIDLWRVRTGRATWAELGFVFK